MLVGDSHGAEAPLARHVVWPCDGLVAFVDHMHGYVRRLTDRYPPPRAGTDPASPPPAACHRPERHDDLEGDPPAAGRPADCTCSTERKGQAASTLALSCSNSAWVMAPLSSRPLADAISSAALLEDSAATDRT